jgi:hypothetical protein
MKARRLLLLACWGAAFVAGPGGGLLVTLLNAPRERGSLMFFLSLACVYGAVPVLTALRYEGPAGIFATGLGVVGTLVLGVMMLTWWRAMAPSVATLTVVDALAHLLLVPCGVTVALHREPALVLHLEGAQPEAVEQPHEAVGRAPGHGTL